MRECLESLNGLVTKAERGSGGINVIVEHIGVETGKSGDPMMAQIKGEAECVTMDSIGIEMERERATSTPSTNQQKRSPRSH